MRFSHGFRDVEQSNFDLDFRGRGVVGEKNKGRIRNRHAANRGDIDFGADRRRWGFGCISGPKFPVDSLHEKKPFSDGAFSDFLPFFDIYTESEV